MKKIIIFAALASVFTFGAFNYLKKPGSELGVLATKAVTPKILNPKNNEVREIITESGQRKLVRVNLLFGWMIYVIWKIKYKL